MTTTTTRPETAYGACQAFVTHAWECGLIKQPDLQAIRNRLLADPDTPPGELADWLVRQQVLSRFQADELLARRGQGLTFWVYTLVEPVGRGSLGTVYKAQGKTDGQTYAIKLVPRRNGHRAAQAQQGLQAFACPIHPVVVPFVRLGTVGDDHYLVWQFVAGGESLRDLLARQGGLPAEQVVRAVRHAAEGLYACHQQGLVHGLLKPSDLLLLRDGQVRLLDIGLGLLLAGDTDHTVFDTSSNLNQHTSALSCASPNVLADPRRRTPADDQYSLGCILYWALTGRFPFHAENLVQRMLEQQEGPAAPPRTLNPAVPEWLEGVVLRMLAREATDRYPDLAAVGRALQGGGAPIAQGYDSAAGRTESERALPAPETVTVPTLRELAARVAQQPVARPTEPWVWAALAAGGVLAAAALWWLVA